jgi:hypothetical protein
MCQECHSGLPGWDQPVPSFSFHDKSSEGLCVHMRQTEATAAAFLAHLENDGGPQNVQFGREAFQGTKGLNDGAKTIYENETGRPFVPQPPPTSHATFMQQARAWVEALGGEFVGSAECGCMPIELELFLESRITGRTAEGQISTHVRATVPLDGPGGDQDLGNAPIEHVANVFPQLPPSCSIADRPTGDSLRVRDLQVVAGSNPNLVMTSANNAPEITVTMRPENTGGTVTINCPGLPHPLQMPALPWAQFWRFVHESARRGDTCAIQGWTYHSHGSVTNGRRLLAEKVIRTSRNDGGVNMTDETTLQLRWILPTTSQARNQDF